MKSNENNSNKINFVNDKRIQLTNFIKGFASSFQPKETLLITGTVPGETRLSQLSRQDFQRADKVSNNDRFNGVYGYFFEDFLKFSQNVFINDIDDNLKKNSKFDFIVADLPLNLGPKQEYIYNKSRKVYKSWNILISLFDFISDSSTLLVIMPNTIINNGKDFFLDLRDNGIYNNLIFKTPERIHPQTGVQTYILGFQKRFTEKQFVAQIEIDFNNGVNNLNTIIENYKLGINGSHETVTEKDDWSNKNLNIKKVKTKDFVNGFWEKRGHFVSFSKYAFQNRFDKLSENYINYKQFELSEIILKDKINIIHKGKFQNTKDAFYIKLVGTITTDFKLENIEKHQHFAQIIINPKIVSLKFLKFFYTSELGIDILKSLKRGLTIQKIYKNDLLKSIVLIPDINEQNSFIDAHEKLSRIEESIKSLKKELSLNPNTKDEVIKKWDELHKPFVKLTKADEIRNLISIGENKEIEFKETLRKCIRKNESDKEVEKTALKNIVAFLNSDGGTLLIGISDNGEIKGIENDIFNNKDKYLLHFTNLIKDKIGPSFFNLINHDIYKVENKLILLVQCKTSKNDVFLKWKGEEEYYIRTNPSAIRLTGSKLLKYTSERQEQFSTSE
jgi:hypothetical protein